MQWTTEKKEKEMNGLRDQLKDLKNEYELLKLQKIVEKENTQRKTDTNKDQPSISFGSAFQGEPSIPLDQKSAFSITPNENAAL